MRVVAKFQFTAPSEGDAVASRVPTLLDKWSDRKFIKTPEGGVVIRHSGASATFDKTSDQIEDRQRNTLTILEAVDGGNLQTDVDIISDSSRTVFRCVLSVGSDGGIAPTVFPSARRASSGTSSRWENGGRSVLPANEFSLTAFRSMSMMYQTSKR